MEEDFYNPLDPDHLAKELEFAAYKLSRIDDILLSDMTGIDKYHKKILKKEKRHYIKYMNNLSDRIYSLLDMYDVIKPDKLVYSESTIQ